MDIDIYRYNVHMQTISLYIEPSQLKRLKAWSKETGAPVSELIRRGIEAALKRRRERTKQQQLIN